MNGFILQVILEATVGWGSKGNIAVDDVSLADGHCVAGKKQFPPFLKLLESGERQFYYLPHLILVLNFKFSVSFHFFFFYFV